MDIAPLDEQLEFADIAAGGTVIDEQLEFADIAALGVDRDRRTTSFADIAVGIAGQLDRGAVCLV